MSLTIKKPIVIALLVHKGGSGKTTSTVALADALVAINPARRVLIIDSDEQSNVKTVFGIKFHSTEGGLAHVLLENVNPENVTNKVRPNIDVIVSGGRMMREFEKTHANTPDAELLMKKRFSGLSEYDYILIDSPPALSMISSNIAAYADYILMPCSPDLLAVVGVKNTITFIEGLQKYFIPKHIPIARVLGVVPTVFDGRRNVDLDILDDLQNLSNSSYLHGGVIFEPIRTDIKVKTAQIKRKLLSEFAPTSKAAEDYRKLAVSVAHRIEEIELPLTKSSISKMQQPNYSEALSPNA